MTEVLQSIVATFQSILDLLGNFISGITQLLTLIPTGLSVLMYSISQMPVVLIGFATALITISSKLFIKSLTDILILSCIRYPSQNA